jgi:CRP/FNR family transcriptional regulator, cyclic AMP receptor protein
MTQGFDAQLPDPLIQAMAARGGTRSFPAQTIVVHEDDHSDAIFIITKGRAKVFGTSKAGREVIYNTLGPGDYFGEMTLDGGPRSASVATLEPTRCIVVPGAQVREFLATHPDFALHLVQKLIGLVRRSTASVKRLALDDVYSRVAQLLEDLAQTDTAGLRVVGERLTQQEIAERVGASREMVSRIFKQLVEGGYVSLQSRRITLLRKLPSGW